MFQTTLKIFAYISDVLMLFSAFLPCKYSKEPICTVLAEGVTQAKLNASNQISSINYTCSCISYLNGYVKHTVQYLLYCIS